MHRTHTCNELRLKNEGEKVTLSGWVHRRRDLGEMIFVTLRDRYGLTQLIFDPRVSKEAHSIAETVRTEWVIKVTGEVKKRAAGQERKDQATGEIELHVENLEVLTKAKTPPFEINNEEKEVAEDIRFKYRYLDLRREKTRKKIEFRAKMNHFAREWFTEKEFLEVQTPIFTVSSPEGARDYLIPSRVHPGKYYALPQAPQQYKQLLMVGGVDKYFQIAPCFRDEDPRADRHCCEFYQLDVEMSFVEQDDVFKTVESFLRDLVTTLAPQKTITENSFSKVPYLEAMNRFGSDKPDGRFAMELVDLSDELKDSGFGVFANAVKDGGTVKAIRLEGQTLTRKEIDELTEVAKKAGAMGLAYLIYENGELRSPIAKFLSEQDLEIIKSKTEAKDGDIVFFGAGEWKTSVTALGNVRLALRDKFNLVDPDDITCLWVTDFPIFEMNEEGKLDFEHNPFSAPQGGMKALEEKDPVTIMGYQYDLAINGMEMLSGSIRNHDPEILLKMFEMVGRTEEDVKEQFGGMYNAFQYGAPPHGGFAIGYDRLLMLLFNEDNIRDIYAFPKSTNAQDLMMGAPAEVPAEDLKELGLK